MESTRPENKFWYVSSVMRIFVSTAFTVYGADAEKIGMSSFVKKKLNQTYLHARSEILSPDVLDKYRYTSALLSILRTAVFSAVGMLMLDRLSPIDVMTFTA